jgi:hypothetical protein
MIKNEYFEAYIRTSGALFELSQIVMNNINRIKKNSIIHEHHCDDFYWCALCDPDGASSVNRPEEIEHYDDCPIILMEKALQSIEDEMNEFKK